MKIKIVKPIKVTEVGPNVLPVGDKEYEVSKGCGDVLVKRGFAVEAKDDKKADKAGEDKKAK